MHQRLLIAAFILGATLLFLRVPTVGADALGLADGTYNITLDFIDDSLAGAGTITVGPGFLTEVHVTVNSAVSSASFDCIGCAVLSPTGDSVLSNDIVSFSIDGSGGLARLLLTEIKGRRLFSSLFLP